MDSVPSNRIDLNAPNVNKYGVQPCPKCGSRNRFVHIVGRIIVCDSCGYDEKVKKKKETV